MAEVKIIGKIFNNVVKGICLGNDLVALQGSARAGKSRNVMIMLVQWCMNPDFVNKLNRAKYLSQLKDREERKANGEKFDDELREPDVLKRVQVSVVRLSMPSLKRSIYKDFVEVMVQMGIFEPRRMNKTEMVYTFPNGSTMEFFATADNEQKVRGSSRDILFVNEANEIGEWEFGQLKMRTYSFSLVDFNPSFTEDHWLFKRINGEKTYHFISTFRDNPFLPQAAVDEINSYKVTNPALWQIFGEGKFAIVEGLVFPRDTWDTITIKDIPNGVKPTRIGIDIGYSGSGDPTAAVIAWFWKEGDVKHVCFNEVLYDTGLNEKQVAQRLRIYNDIPKYIDSANPLYIQNLEDSGLQLVYPTKKYANSVIDGIMKMQGYKLHILKTSSNLIKEFNNYCWMKDRREQFTSVPIDKFNHCFVAGTKVMTIYGEKNIEDVRVGDRVVTTDGDKKVLKKFENGKQEVFRFKIEFEQGVIVELVSTYDHSVMTGYDSNIKKEIGKLIPGDICRFFNENHQVCLGFIKSINLSDWQIANTYNIMVDEKHEYFANGLLVSNCIDAARYSVLADRTGRFDDKTIFTKAELGFSF